MHTTLVRLAHRAVEGALAFTALVALPLACSDSTLESGLTVHVVIDAPRTPARTGHDATFTTDRGVVVHLTKAFLTTESAEIVPCGSTASLLDGVRGAFRIRSAFAHSTASPTKIGAPFVEDLLAATDVSTAFGALAPPPAKYCTLRYSVGAADDDAPGLPADGSMVGKSLYIVGDYTLPSGAAPTAFSIEASAAFDRDLAFEPLDLSASGAHAATLVVDKGMEHWFDGIDFATVSDDARARAVLTQVQSSLTVSRR